MALVRNINRWTKDRQRRHEETNCFASNFIDKEGVRYLQIDTTGTKMREVTDVVSQSMQFDKQAASKLKLLIEEVFPDLK